MRGMSSAHLDVSLVRVCFVLLLAQFPSIPASLVSSTSVFVSSGLFFSRRCTAQLAAAKDFIFSAV